MTEKTARIDKWLWSVRAYKTRSLATAACRSGKVRIEGNQVKPSRMIRVGDVIHFRKDSITRVYKVNSLIEKRVSAKLAVDHYDEMTPQDELEKLEHMKSGQAWREKGKGRPTKKDRRIIDNLKD